MEGLQTCDKGNADKAFSAVESDQGEDTIQKLSQQTDNLLAVIFLLQNQFEAVKRDVRGIKETVAKLAPRENARQCRKPNTQVLPSAILQPVQEMKQLQTGVVESDSSRHYPFSTNVPVFGASSVKVEGTSGSQSSKQKMKKGKHQSNRHNSGRESVSLVDGSHATPPQSKDVIQPPNNKPDELPVHSNSESTESKTENVFDELVNLKNEFQEWRVASSFMPAQLRLEMRQLGSVQKEQDLKIDELRRFLNLQTYTFIDQHKILLDEIQKLSQRQSSFSDDLRGLEERVAANQEWNEYEELLDGMSQQNEDICEVMTHVGKQIKELKVEVKKQSPLSWRCDTCTATNTGKRGSQKFFSSNSGSCILDHPLLEGGHSSKDQLCDPHDDLNTSLLESLYLTTGEEGEEEVFKAKGKLFRFDSNIKKWLEVCVGEVKILKNLEIGRTRLLVKTEKLHKICANHWLKPEMRLLPNLVQSSGCAHFCYAWNAVDFAKGEKCHEWFSLGFDTQDLAEKFKIVFYKMKALKKESSGNRGDSRNSYGLRKKFGCVQEGDDLDDVLDDSDEDSTEDSDQKQSQRWEKASLPHEQMFSAAESSQCIKTQMTFQEVSVRSAQREMCEIRDLTRPEHCQEARNDELKVKLRESHEKALIQNKQISETNKKLTESVLALEAEQRELTNRKIDVMSGEIIELEKRLTDAEDKIQVVESVQEDQNQKKLELFEGVVSQLEELKKKNIDHETWQETVKQTLLMFQEALQTNSEKLRQQIEVQKEQEKHNSEIQGRMNELLQKQKEIESLRSELQKMEHSVGKLDSGGGFSLCNYKFPSFSSSLSAFSATNGLGSKGSNNCTLATFSFGQTTSQSSNITPSSSARFSLPGGFPFAQPKPAASTFPCTAPAPPSFESTKSVADSTTKEQLATFSFGQTTSQSSNITPSSSAGFSLPGGFTFAQPKPAASTFSFTAPAPPSFESTKSVADSITKEQPLSNPTDTTASSQQTMTTPQFSFGSGMTQFTFGGMNQQKPSSGFSFGSSPGSVPPTSQASNTPLSSTSTQPGASQATPIFSSTQEKSFTSAFKGFEFGGKTSEPKTEQKETISFSDLVKYQGEFSFRLNVDNVASSPPKSGSKSPVKSTGLNKSGKYYQEEERDDIYFEPVVTLPENYKLETGEENEEVKFSQQAKLYRFDVEDLQWKERGVGGIKVLYNPETKHHRIVMRRDQVLKVCANHYITQHVNLQPNAGSERSWVWQAMDISDGEPQNEQLAVRFKTEHAAKEFKEVVDEAKKNLPETSEKTEQSKERQKKKIFGIDDNNDDVIFMGEVKATPEQVAKAEKLMLPPNFYLYEQRPPCPGCKGCEEEDLKAKKEGDKPAAVEEKSSSVFPEKAKEPASQTPSFFGNAAISSLSFASLSADGDASIAKKDTSTKPFQFAGAGSLLFGSAKQDDDNVAEDQEYDPHYDPIISLPENVDLKTGDEGQEVVFKERAKLYRYDSDTQAWKERGVGDMKILRDPETGKARILMRREQVLKVCANHWLTPDMQLLPMSASDRAFVWNAMDFAEEEECHEKFAIKFKTPELAAGFKEAFDEMKKGAKPKVAPAEEKPVEKVEDVKSAASPVEDDSGHRFHQADPVVAHPEEGEEDEDYDGEYDGEEDGYGDEEDYYEDDDDDDEYEDYEDDEEGEEEEYLEKEAPPKEPSLSEMFKPASGSWDCDICMVNNPADKTQCLACSTPKPGTSQPSEGASNDTQGTTSRMGMSGGAFSLGNIKFPSFSFSLSAFSAGSGFVSSGSTKSTPATFSFGQTTSQSSNTTPSSSGGFSLPGGFTFAQSKPETTQRSDSGFKMPAASSPFSSTAPALCNSETQKPSSGFSFGSSLGNVPPTSQASNTPLSSTSTQPGASQATQIFGSTQDKSFASSFKGFEFGGKTSEPKTEQKDLVKNQGEFSFSLNVENVVSSPPKSGSKSLVKSPRLNKSGEYFQEERDDIYFEPVVTLPENYKLETGEENEEVKFSQRAKLYRFDVEGSQWKERGVGDIKVLYNPETKQHRIVMRRDQVLKVCANHYITQHVNLQPNAGSERSWVWQAMDISDGEPQNEQLAVRFQTEDAAKEFKEVVDEAKKNISETSDKDEQSTKEQKKN